MKKLEDFVCRQVLGQQVMVPMGETARKFSGMILATETGAFIWEHIEQVDSAEEMAQLLTQEYEVPYEQALDDVSELFGQFRKAGWID